LSIFFSEEEIRRFQNELCSYLRAEPRIAFLADFVFATAVLYS
jgi:hypothetical protein